MMRRRNSPSPYEVMTSPQYADDKPTDDPVAAHPRSVAAPPPETIEHGVGTAGWWASWWGQTQHPVVLRLPKGQAALLGLVFFLMILLAYWVGVMRGYRSGQREPSLQSVIATEALPDTRSSSPPVALPDDPATRDRPTRAAHLGDFSPVARVQSDPRQVGLNYFVLAHYPKEDAHRLVQFLANEGVPAAGFGKHGKNRYQVVALEGFHKDELDSSDYNQYKQKLLRLGHVWHSRGLGPNFSGIFPALYNGQNVDEMIISEVQP